VAHPISVTVETFGSGKIGDDQIAELVRTNFDFSPSGMIRYYNLRRPIYKACARYGHLGVDRPEVTWEKLEKVETLKRAAGAKSEAKKTAKARK
jgi:S-adenosylmethionine synthetase